MEYEKPGESVELLPLAADKAVHLKQNQLVVTALLTLPAYPVQPKKRIAFSHHCSAAQCCKNRYNYTTNESWKSRGKKGVRLREVILVVVNRLRMLPLGPLLWLSGLALLLVGRFQGGFLRRPVGPFRVSSVRRHLP